VALALTLPVEEPDTTQSHAAANGEEVRIITEESFGLKNTKNRQNHYRKLL
jgi:hypothetical protein